MKYEALEMFRDSDGHVYEEKSPYPAKGKPKKERLEVLLTSNNRYGRPFVQEVKESKQNEEAPVEEVGAEAIEEVKESKQKSKEGK